MNTNRADHGLDRRTFLKTLAFAGAAVALKGYGGVDTLTQAIPDEGGGEVDLVAVMGGEPEELFARGIAELGGLERFVKPGFKVVVKPNIAWDRDAQSAANTNPQLVAEIVRQCLAVGAADVTVFDHTCDQWRRSYTNSGIEDAARRAGATVVPADQESYYRAIDLPRGRKLQTALVHQALLESDAWINVPVLKNHGGAKLTMAMKNHMGIVWDRRFFHRNDLQQCIADICTLEKKAALNVVDTYRTMITNGPRGRSAADVVQTRALFMSSDIVAVDTAAARFFNQVRDMPIDQVRYLAAGQDLGVGTMDLPSLNIKRLTL